jgi:D-alanyl-D-alanine dipeptidase
MSMMSVEQLLQALRSDPDFRSLSGLPGIEIQLAYARKENFMGRNVYGAFREAFLHREAAEALAEAARRVADRRPGCFLRVYDALRPHRFQFDLWAIVKGTSEESYVADPALGSIHAYGLAVDLSVCDASGAPLDMGTPFDGFSRLSEPRFEPEYLRTGELTQEQYANRLLLRQAMEAAGFLSIPNEWWHFNRYPSAEIRARYRRID